MNYIKKIISIIFFAIIYLVVVEIIEANFRTKDDFASGLLYIVLVRPCIVEASSWYFSLTTQTSIRTYYSF